MKGSAHPGDKNFRKSKRSLLEGGFSGIVLCSTSEGNAMIFLKFADTARKTVFLNIILPHLQGQGTFVLKFSLKKLPVKNFSFHGCLFKIVHAHFFFFTG